MILRNQRYNVQCIHTFSKGMLHFTPVLESVVTRNAELISDRHYNQMCGVFARRNLYCGTCKEYHLYNSRVGRVMSTDDDPLRRRKVVFMLARTHTFYRVYRKPQSRISFAIVNYIC